MTDSIVFYGGDSKIDRWECEKAVKKNTLDNGSVRLGKLFLVFGYELLYKCTVDPPLARDRAIAEIEEALLMNAKDKFLYSPSVCSRPQKHWFAAVDSKPPDFPATKACGVFSTNVLDTGDCCTVVQGNMTFLELSEVDMDDMNDWIKKQLNNGQSGTPSRWFGNTYRTSYIGPDPVHVEVVQTQPGTSTSAISNDPVPTTMNDNSFTLPSILMLCFCILCILLVLGFIIHRRRNNRKEKQLPNNVDDDNGWIQPRGLPAGDLALTKVPNRELQIHVMGDEMEDYLDNIEVASLASHPFQDTSTSASPTSDKYNYSLVSPSTNNTTSPRPRHDWHDEVAEDEVSAGHHAQVLTYTPQYESNSNGRPPLPASHPSRTHGGGFAIIPYDGEVSADNTSEVDSWAQSQGCSIGSLEQQEYGCDDEP